MVLEDTIIHHNIKYENITPKGTIITDSKSKLLKAIDQTTHKLYSIRVISVNEENDEEIIKSEISFLDKVCKYYYKPKSFPTYFGHVKLSVSGEKQYLLFFNPIKSSFLDYLILKEKNKQLFPLEDLMKFSEMIINGLAFCQSMNFILKDFSSQNFLYDIDSENKPLLTLMNFTHLNLLKNIESNQKNQSFIGRNEDIIAPELFNPQIKMNNTVNYYKSGVFSFGVLIMRMGLGHSLFEGNMNFYLNLLNDEANFENAFDTLMKNLEKNYSNHEKAKIYLPKLINNLKNMLKFNPEERPDFLELYRTNIDLEDLEKFKAHILVSEGLMLPLIEKYDNFSVNGKDHTKEENKKFELSSSDKMIKISGVGGMQIKQTFSDEKLDFICVL